jgi:hypothetical protein
MDTRSTYLRRNTITTRLQQRMAMAVLAGVAGGVAILAVLPGPRLDRAAPAAATAPAASAAARTFALGESKPAPKRRIYPFSIIPGGVASREDVLRAMRSDKVVADHYAGFAADKAQVQTVPAARAVYVSYRKGDQVFWTKHKVMLAEGETVLSDGTNLIRGRCGNRISDTPRLPVEAHGPSPEVLDSSTEEGGDSMVDASYTDGQAGTPGGRYQIETFPVNTGSGPAGNGSNAAADRFGPGLQQADLPLYASRTGTITAATPVVSTNGGTTDTTVDTGASAGGTLTDTTSAPSGTTTPGAGPVLAATGSGGNGTTGTTGTTGTDDTPALPWPPQLPTTSTPTATTPTDEVPEPGTLWLSGIAFAALVLGRRKRGAKAASAS